MAPKADRVPLNKGKRARTDQGSSSQPAPYTIVCHAPPVWPRNENTPFAVEFVSETTTLRHVLTSKEVDDREFRRKWDDFNSLLYNEWMKVPMAPIKFAHHLSMSQLEIEEEVMELLERVGLTKLATHDEGLYPGLVRQFFASVKLNTDAVSDEEKKDPRFFKMSFMANGTRYALSAREICRIFEFPEVPAGDLPLDIAGGVHTLWSQIGAGPFIVGSSTHSDIRHPVIRYLVRLFSTTILCKLEPGKVRKHELVLLSYALRDLIPNETWTTGFQPNMAMVFMDYLHSLRHTPLTATTFGKKQFTVGNMLTPIFKRCKISLTGYSVDGTDGFVNMEHMKNAHWIKTDYPLCWVFPVALGQSRMVEIRKVIDLMPVTTNVSLLSFQPAADLLRPVEATRKMTTRGTGTSRASSSATPPQHLHVFPSAPRANLNEEERFQWLTRALQANWDALSCRSACVRPCTPSPPPAQSPASPSAEEED